MISLDRTVALLTNVFWTLLAVETPLVHCVALANRM